MSTYRDAIRDDTCPVCDAPVMTRPVWDDTSGMVLTLDIYRYTAAEGGRWIVRTNGAVWIIPTMPGGYREHQHIADSG